MVTDAEYAAATKRGREMRKNVPHAIGAKYDTRLNRILITLSNRLEVALAPETSQALQHATPAQLRKVEISGAGYHIYFPKLDDGVYLPSLLRGIFGSQTWMEDQAVEDRRKLAASSKSQTRKQKAA